MKMLTEMNKVSLKKAIKDLFEEYGRRNMEFEVTINIYSDKEIELVENYGKEYRYEILISAYKNNEYITSFTHKALPSDLYRGELDEKTKKALYKVQDEMIEWVRKNYQCEPKNGVKRIIFGL